MRQWRQVTRSTQRTLLIDDGDDVVVVHVNKSLNGSYLHAGVAVSKRLNLKQHHQLDNLGGHAFAGAASV